MWSANHSIRFDLKTTLAVPLLLVLGIGICHAVYLLCFSINNAIPLYYLFPDWSLFGRGIRDDVPVWLMLGCLAFTLGFSRPVFVRLAVVMLSISLFVSEALIFRNFSFLAALGAGLAQLPGCIFVLLAGYYGWWYSEGEESLNLGLSRIAVAILWLTVIAISTYGWWGLTMNTIQVPQEFR